MRGRWYPAAMFGLATLLMVGWYWYSDRFLYQPMTLEDMLTKVEKNPNDAEALYRAGQMYRQLSRPDRAKEQLGRAVRLSPDNPMYRAGLGEALLDSGEWDAAAGEFEVSVKLDPKNPYPMYRAGVAYRSAGDLNRARVMLDRALNQIPAMPEGDKSGGGESQAHEERIVAFHRQVLDEIARLDRIQSQPSPSPVMTESVPPATRPPSPAMSATAPPATSPPTPARTQSSPESPRGGVP